MSERFDEINPASDLAPLADALKALTPAATGINRDRLLFEAGRSAAVSRFAWVWPVGTFAFGGLAVVFAGFVAFAERKREVVVVERVKIVEVQVPVPIEVGPEPRHQSAVPNDGSQVDSRLNPEAVQMYQVRRDVLRWGVVMLPPSRPVAKMPLRSGDSAREIERWLDVPAGTFAGPVAKPAVRLFPNINGDN
jgi:hypothetical protein